MIKKVFVRLKERGIKDTMAWAYRGVKFRLNKPKLIASDFDAINLTEEEKKYVVPKKGHNIFIIANIPYYDIGGGQRCSSLARTFNQMGYNVYYLYAFASSESKIFDLPMPMNLHLLVNEENVKKIESIVQKDDLFIFESPCSKFNEIIDLAISKEAKIIYENIDNWETSLGNTVYDEKTLIKILEHSDLLVGTAKPLVEQLNGYLKKYNLGEKKIEYLPNAANDELFCGIKELEKPKDMVTGKKTFLYYGSLWGEWFDWDIVLGLAKNNPEYEINLIGDYHSITHIVNKVPNNVHFLGLKKQTDLPNYLKYTDYSLIPFKTGEISDYVSPLKVFEYIGMYTKVLSCTLPDIKGYPNVYLGDTLEKWEEVIKEDKEVDKSAADSFMTNNSWFARASKMLDIIYPDLNTSILKDNLAVIILNYNNYNVIFKCVDTLLKFNEIYNYEIIVVDNGSSDGSYEELLKRYKEPEVKIVKNSQNGCSSGRNLGVSNTTRQYLMFLDSDQWVTNKYFLHPYEMILKENNDIGAIGWAAGFFTKDGISYYTVDNFNYRFMPPCGLCREDISYLGSGGMLLTRDLFSKIGGFDINFDPTCYEDTDLSLKIENAGKKIIYCPYLGVIHLPHQTTKSGTKDHDDLLKKHGDYFYSKWEKENKDLLFKHIK